MKNLPHIVEAEVRHLWNLRLSGRPKPTESQLRVPGRLKVGAPVSKRDCKSALRVQADRKTERRLVVGFGRPEGWSVDCHGRAIDSQILSSDGLIQTIYGLRGYAEALCKSFLGLKER